MDLTGSRVARPVDLETIVVPLDGSEFAQPAVQVAGQFAQRLGADVLLLSVVADAVDADKRSAQLDAMQPSGDHVHRSVVVDADPAHAIHDVVEGLDHAIVCMASHGRGRFAGLVSSVATEVLTRSVDPVVLVGPWLGQFAPWISRRTVPTGVVVCVDDSPTSDLLVSLGSRWAEVLRQPLIVLTVAEVVWPGLDDTPARRRFGPDGDVEAFLEAVTAPVLNQGMDVASLALYDAISPADSLSTYLRVHPPALVVVGSRTRTGFARLVFGSNAAGIVSGSPVPVLVVPHPAAQEQ